MRGAAQGGGARLCADGQPPAPAGYAGRCAGSEPDDAVARPPLRGDLQQAARPQRHAVGWPFPRGAARGRLAPAGLHALHRAEPAAARLSPTAPGLPPAAHHLGPRRDPLVLDHALFWTLGNTPFEREAAYQAWLEQGVGEEEGRQLADSALKGWPLPSPQFFSTPP